VKWLLPVYLCTLFTIGWTGQIEDINQQVRVLQDRKNRYKASARRHQDNVDRWQFDSSRIDEVRREQKYIQEDLVMMQDIEDKIEELCQEKQKLLHGS
jgi:hypothetical protein